MLSTNARSASVNASGFAGSNTPAKAADGDESTYWEASEHGQPQWLEVALMARERGGIKTEVFATYPPESD